jgi:hypothetical protein
MITSYQRVAQLAQADPAAPPNHFFSTASDPRRLLSDFFRARGTRANAEPASTCLE